MFTENTINDPTQSYGKAQVLMTLAAIAYADPSDIRNELKNTGYATENEWHLVWGPVDTVYSVYFDNLMYVVQYKDENVYAVVIRGTVLAFGLSTFVDLFEDLDVSFLYPWTYPIIEGASVSGGTLTGLDVLISMTDRTGQTLVQFFRNHHNSIILVTGHSLGGCLTTVLAPWLRYQFALKEIDQLLVVAYTFAAPTAGNQQFADWYDQSFGKVMTYRYFNTIDAIPMAWNNLSGIKNLFPDGTACPWAMAEVIDLVNDWLYALGDTYVQTNGNGTPLIGTSLQNPDWFTEIGHQHDHNTYLQLLGAPPIDVSLSAISRTKYYKPILMQPEKFGIKDSIHPKTD